MMARGGYAVAAVTLAAARPCGMLVDADESRTSSAPPPALQPLPNSTVAQNNLPPIGQDGRVTVAQPGMVNPNLTGQPTTTGPTHDPGAADAQRSAPIRRSTANNDRPSSPLDSVGSVPAQPGRDLTGGLNVRPCSAAGPSSPAPRSAAST